MLFMSSTNFSQIAAFLCLSPTCYAAILNNHNMDELFSFYPFASSGMRTRNNERRGDTEAKKVKAMKLPEEAQEKMTCGRLMASRSSMPQRWISAKGAKWHTGQPGKLHPVVLFGCREIFEHFKFSEFVGQLADATCCSKWCKYSLKQIYTQSTLQPRYGAGI